MWKARSGHRYLAHHVQQVPLRCVAFVILPLVCAACQWPQAPLIGAEPGDVSRPNIVLIMADDLGYAELGCYGQQKIKTPHIDAMAAEGIRFTQHYTSAPVCAPARCCLMTGRHAGHALVRDNAERHPADYLFGDTFGGQYPLPAGTVTMASLLKQAGYVTGAFGKWGLGGVGTSGDPLNQGFDRFFGYNCQRHAHNLYPTYLVDDRRQRMLPGNTAGVTGETYAPQQVADEMLAFVRANRERPFFVYYPTVIPHLALQVPEAELAAYRGQWPETPYTGQSYQPHPTPRAAYAAMISFFDKQVGRLFSLLKELDLDNRTIVLLTSDNGTTHLAEQVDAAFFQSVGPLRGLKGIGVRRRHSRSLDRALARSYSAGHSERSIGGPLRPVADADGGGGPDAAGGHGWPELSSDSVGSAGSAAGARFLAVGFRGIWGPACRPSRTMEGDLAGPAKEPGRVDANSMIWPRTWAKRRMWPGNTRRSWRNWSRSCGRPGSDRGGGLPVRPVSRLIESAANAYTGGSTNGASRSLARQGILAEEQRCQFAIC